MRTAPHLNRRARTILCAVACASVLPLTACAGGDDTADAAAPSLSAVEETSSIATTTTADTKESAKPTRAENESETAQTEATTGAASNPGDDGDARCGDMTAEEAMYAGLEEVGPPPFDGRDNWSTEYADPTAGYDPCADLSWISLLPDMPTGSTPAVVMLYHKGEYVGTTTAEPRWTGRIERDSDSQITVEYIYAKDGEPLGLASGRTYATFTWNGDKVVMEGELP